MVDAFETQGHGKSLSFSHWEALNGGLNKSCSVFSLSQGALRAPATTEKEQRNIGADISGETPDCLVLSPILQSEGNSGQRRSRFVPAALWVDPN